MVSCLGKDPHGGTQCELDVGRLQIAVCEVGGKLKVSDGVVRLRGDEALSFGFEAQADDILLAQSDNVLNLEMIKIYINT